MSYKEQVGKVFSNLLLSNNLPEIFPQIWEYVPSGVDAEEIFQWYLAEKRSLASDVEDLLFFLLFALFFFLVAHFAVRANEEHECRKWKLWEEQRYQYYYVTDWQVEQCAQYGVEFSSRVWDTVRQEWR